MLIKQIIPQDQIDRAKFCLDEVRKDFGRRFRTISRRNFAMQRALFAEALKKKKNIKEAMAALEEALKIDPNNETAKKVMNESKIEYSQILLQRAKDALATMEFG